MTFPKVPAAAVVLYFCTVLCSIYLPGAGLGFVKDDVVWVRSSRIAGAEDLSRLFVASTGFFRPVVSASFALNYALFGMRPRGYGVTNLLLMFGGVAAVAWLVRSLGASRPVAIGAGFVWAFNFHGINMAVLWLSGRTALWLCLWWTLAAAGFVRRARVWPIAAAALAMMSKEEGFALPAMLAVWAWLEAAPLPAAARAATVLKRTGIYWVTAAILLTMRAQSGAMTPWNAPSYYTYQPLLDGLLPNAVEYADRSMLAPLCAIALLWLGLGRPRIGDVDTTQVWRGLAWLLIAFAPTILLPSRSSLYALLPSIGTIVALAPFADRWVRGASPARLRTAGAILAAAVLALWPVYKLRTLRYAGEGRLSAEVLDHVAAIANERGRGLVLLRDDTRDTRPTAEQAFGGLAADASALMSNGAIVMWIDPPPADLTAAGDVTPPALPVIGEIRVREGRAERLR